MIGRRENRARIGYFVTFDAGTADFYNARIHTPVQPDIREEGAATG